MLECNSSILLASLWVTAKKSGYVKGQRFGQHVDGSRDEPELGGRTHFTVLVYLNGGDRDEIKVKGGETVFWKDGNSKIFVIFTPFSWGNDPNLTIFYFSNGWEKPPTRCFGKIMMVNDRLWLFHPLAEYVCFMDTAMSV